MGQKNMSTLKNSSNTRKTKSQTGRKYRRHPAAFLPRHRRPRQLRHRPDDQGGKQKIVISEPKPVFVASTFLDLKLKRDALKLSDKINGRLRDLSAKGKEAPLIFSEGTGYPGAYQISGTYITEGNNVVVDYVVIMNDLQIGKDMQVKGNIDNIDYLIEQIISSSRVAIN